MQRAEERRSTVQLQFLVRTPYVSDVARDVGEYVVQVVERGVEIEDVGCRRRIDGWSRRWGNEIG